MHNNLVLRSHHVQIARIEKADRDSLLEQGAVDSLYVSDESPGEFFAAGIHEIPKVFVNQYGDIGPRTCTTAEEFGCNAVHCFDNATGFVCPRRFVAVKTEQSETVGFIPGNLIPMIPETDASGPARHGTQNPTANIGSIRDATRA